MALWQWIPLRCIRPLRNRPGSPHSQTWAGFLLNTVVAADSTDPVDPLDLSMVVGSTLMGAVSGQIGEG